MISFRALEHPTPDGEVRLAGGDVVRVNDISEVEPVTADGGQPPNPSPPATGRIHPVFISDGRLVALADDKGNGVDLNARAYRVTYYDRSRVRTNNALIGVAVVLTTLATAAVTAAFLVKPPRCSALCLGGSWNLGD